MDKGVKLPLHLRPAPMACRCLSSASGQISGDVRFSQEWEPTVNRTCKGSRLRAPYKNLMLDDLILYCGELHNYFITYHNAIITEIKYNERNELESS